MKRSPATNAFVVLGIVAVFILLGTVIWARWDAAANSAAAAQSSNSAALWGLVIIGGPLTLLAAIIWAKLRTRRVTRVEDPETPSDDPSKGMSGHD